MSVQNLANIQGTGGGGCLIHLDSRKKRKIIISVLHFISVTNCVCSFDFKIFIVIFKIQPTYKILCP